MTCVNPITVWKKRWASLTDSPQKYYEDKKVKFKKPRDYQNYEEIKIDFIEKFLDKEGE